MNLLYLDFKTYSCQYSVKQYYINVKHLLNIQYNMYYDMNSLKLFI